MYQVDIEPSQSPFSNPLILVAKKDGSTRPVLDLRELKKKLLPYSSISLPRIDDSLNAIAYSGHKRLNYLTSLDLISAHYQIRLPICRLSSVKISENSLISAHNSRFFKNSVVHHVT